MDSSVGNAEAQASGEPSLAAPESLPQRERAGRRLKPELQDSASSEPNGQTSQADVDFATGAADVAAKAVADIASRPVKVSPAAPASTPDQPASRVRKTAPLRSTKPAAPRNNPVDKLRNGSSGTVAASDATFSVAKDSAAAAAAAALTGSPRTSANPSSATVPSRAKASAAASASNLSQNPDALAAAAQAAAAAAAAASLRMATLAASRPAPPPSSTSQDSSKAGPSRRLEGTPGRSSAPGRAAGQRLAGQGRGSPVAAAAAPASGPAAGALGDAAGGGSVDAGRASSSSIVDELLVDKSKLMADKEVLSVQVRKLASQVQHLTEQQGMLAGELQRLLSRNSSLNVALASTVTTCESQAELVEILSEAVRCTVLVDPEEGEAGEGEERAGEGEEGEAGGEEGAGEGEADEEGRGGAADG